MVGSPKERVREDTHAALKRTTEMTTAFGVSPTSRYIQYPTDVRASAICQVDGRTECQ